MPVSDPGEARASDRPPATVVVPVWNAWATTKACLQALRSTLGDRDRVVVVDNGSSDATPAALAEEQWVQVVRNATNCGFAAACNQGAASASTEILVFLNNDTLPTAGWLDRLLEPFGHPEVGAAGPVSNRAGGSQLAQIPGNAYRDDDPRSLERFTSEWAVCHRGSIRQAARLSGFCFATRREAFEGVGGFDESYGIGGYEDDDISMRLRAAGWRLVIAESCFLHHAGHATFDANGLVWHEHQRANRGRFVRSQQAQKEPLLSTCVVAGKEAGQLDAVLGSIEGLDDDLVVLVNDAMPPELAERVRSRGATVIAPRDASDRAGSRNEALQAARGRFVLWLEAGESVLGAADAILESLVGAADAAAYRVSIRNLTAYGVGTRSWTAELRLFPRALVSWQGTGLPVLTQSCSLSTTPLVGACLLHFGAMADIYGMASRAELAYRSAHEVLPEGLAQGLVELDLARKSLVAERLATSVTHAERAVALLAAEPSLLRLASRILIEGLAERGQVDRAQSALEHLRAACHCPVLPDLLESALLERSRDSAGALRSLERVRRAIGSDGAEDDDGYRYTSDMLASRRAQLLADLGRHAEAADILIGLLSAKSSCRRESLAGDVAVLAASLAASGRGQAELAAAVEASELAGLVLPQVAQLEGGLASEVLAALLARHEGSLAVLATAASIARRLPVAEAIGWSSRLRTAGLAESCPLRAIADDPARDPLDRAQAALVAYKAFGDNRALPAFRAVAGTMAAAGHASMLEESVRQIAPELAGELGDLRSLPAPRRLPYGLDAHMDTSRYHRWIERHERRERSNAEDGSEPGPLTRPSGPLVSVLVPVHRPPAEYLRACIESVRAQGYGKWELCMSVSDPGDRPAARLLEEAPLADCRIRVRHALQASGISANTNSALAMATGELIGFLDQDDVLAPRALEAMVDALEEAPSAVAAYSDEDVLLGENRRVTPFFKPDWSPDYLLQCNYVNHFVVVRRGVLQSLAGLSPDADGAQDWDLLLRLGELGSDIIHVPEVLYHWRSWSESMSRGAAPKPWAVGMGRQVVERALARRGEAARTALGLLPGWFEIARRPVTPADVVLDARRAAEGTEAWLQLLHYRMAAGEVASVEVVTDDGTGWKAVDDACSRGRAPSLCLVSADARPTSGNWLPDLIAQVERDGIGAAGARLLGVDGTLRHAGNVVGMGATVGNLFEGLPAGAVGYMGWDRCTREVSAVSGACIALSRRSYETAGGFHDEMGPLAAVDLCLRIRDAGERVLYVPSAELVVSDAPVDDPEAVRAAEAAEAAFRARWMPGGTYRDPYFPAAFARDRSWCTLALPDEGGPAKGRHARSGGPDASIVIPLFNRADLTRRCIEALAANTPAGRYELVLVDNGSRDSTGALLDELEHADLPVIIQRNKDNLGYARACNQGVCAASGKHMVLLNNDTEACPGWFEPLVEALESNPLVGAAGAKLVYSDGTIQHAGLLLAETAGGDLEGLHRFLRFPADHPAANVREPVAAVTGAAVALRREALDAAGGLDEEFWNGDEDLDLCLKLQALGWQILYVPESSLVHHESGSGLERYRSVAQNRALLSARWLDRVPPGLLSANRGPGTANARTATRTATCA